MTMFDGSSIWTRQKGLAVILLGCNELIFTEKYVMDTYELIKYEAYYYGLKFEICASGLIRIRGSLHKFFNMGLFNDDDFTYGKLYAVICHLRDNFDIDTDVAEIHHLEYGFNLDMPYNTKEYLSRIISYKGKPFNQYEMGDYMYCEMKNAVLKIYNKNTILNNKLRIEWNAKKMSACKAGPLSLSDLLKPKIWDICANQLFDTFAQVIMTDRVDLAQLNSIEKSIYEFGTNPRNWNSSTVTTEQRYSLKRSFNEVILNHGQFQDRPKLLSQMKQKYSELLSVKSL